jgi:3-deoxy-manno-octulosonate cytidylyltransferase (CMP-KDO synthetase)
MTGRSNGAKGRRGSKGLKKVVAVIPARWGSTRFPGKPLAEIAGKPLVQRVWERCCAAGCFDAVYVATDNARIAAAVRGFGGKAIRTSPCCASGTDRVAEVARKISAGIYLNVQGDGPFVGRKELRDCVAAARKAGRREFVTSVAPITSRKSWENPCVVKVVADPRGNALYFSRSPIPGQRGKGWPKGIALAHLSVYAFRRSSLLEYCRLKPSLLEKAEGLEMLRALESGWKIKLIAAHEIHPEIDVPSDIAFAEAYLKKKGRFDGLF